MKKVRDFKGVWIPKDIWLSRNLSLQEKAFLVEIDSLDNDEKGCFAGNKYFAEFFDLSEKRCSEVISSLHKKNMIDVSIEKSSGKSIRKILSLANIPTTDKAGVGVAGKQEWPLHGKQAPNNTVSNNTVNKEDTAETAGNEQAKKIIELFKGVRPSYELLFKRKHEWAAARRLVDIMPFEELEKIIRFLPRSNTMPYCPVVTSPAKLEEKLEDLRAFWIKEKQKSNKNQVIKIS